MMTCATDLQGADTTLGGYRSFDVSCLGDAAAASNVADVFDTAVSTLLAASGRLGATCATDGHYLQQASRELDQAANSSGGSDGGSSGGGSGSKGDGGGVPR
ncbi:hypothetical protein AVL62_12135 [Serinicoccus chungangensis]|uniref:Uncharacterized protein n=2 Tax=Serinicoccus chungangensis TaxID=767452 RepID=A0A0W8IB78_9MICO|nr:hypothetical protein AVL62_12135 [Serinicoccus chungangensis]